MRQGVDVHVCTLCFQVMRNACAGIGSSASGVGNGSVGSKEMHYVLRVLGPAACRCPSFFSNVARNSLQIALPPQNKILRGEKDPMLPLIGLSVCLSFLFHLLYFMRERLPNYSVTLQSILLSAVKCSFENSAWSVCDRWKVNGCNRNTEISSLCSVLHVRTELVRCFKHFYHAMLTVFLS